MNDNVKGNEIKRGKRKLIAAKLAEGARQAAKDNASRPTAEKDTGKDR